MNITCSTKELSMILETARDAKQNKLKNWKFLIKYKSIASSVSTLDSDVALTAKNTLFSYKKGDKMILLLNITEARYAMRAAFKLNENISNKTGKLSITLSQSTSLNCKAMSDRCSFTPTASDIQNLPRSPRRSLQIKTSRSRTKSPRRRSQSNTIKSRPRRKTARFLEPAAETFSLKRKSIKPTAEGTESVEEREKIVQLEQVIRSLKGENDLLLNKAQQIKSKKERESKEHKDKIWLRQKIERMEKNIDTKIMKAYGIYFKCEHQWKEIISLSFNVLVKLAKTIHSKEAESESVCSKWMKTKKENKELIKSNEIKTAQLEKQRNLINDLKQNIAQRDDALSKSKQNERNLEEKIKRMEKEFVRKQNCFDEEIAAQNEEKVRLNVKLNNSIQEMKETKTDFDELQAHNAALSEQINELKYCIHETNEKSRGLIECIKNSQQIMNGFASYTEIEPICTASDAEGDEAKMNPSNGFSTRHSNNNYV